MGGYLEMRGFLFPRKTLKRDDLIPENGVAYMVQFSIHR
jgi:hypothetical protein